MSYGDFNLSDIKEKFFISLNEKSNAFFQMLEKYNLVTI